MYILHRNTSIGLKVRGGKEDGDGKAKIELKLRSERTAEGREVWHKILKENLKLKKDDMVGAITKTLEKCACSSELSSDQKKQVVECIDFFQRQTVMPAAVLAKKQRYSMMLQGGGVMEQTDILVRLADRNLSQEEDQEEPQTLRFRSLCFEGMVDLEIVKLVFTKIAEANKDIGSSFIMVGGYPEFITRVYPVLLEKTTTQTKL